MADLNEKGGIDPKSFLLPKKEANRDTSATRVNAGVLLEQEQTAELPKQEAPKPIEPVKRPEGPVDTAPIAPLKTYQTDVESVISGRNISATDIVAAESNRAQKGGMQILPKQIDWGKLKKAGIMSGSILLLMTAAALLYFVLFKPIPSVPGFAQLPTPYIGVDDTQVLLLSPAQFNRATLMQNLENIKNQTAISLGLISRMYVIVSTSTIENEIPPATDVRSLLSTLAPNTTAEFLRTLDPNYYVLGVHVFDGNQPFLIVRAESYEQAFSGMLEWERTIQAELSPLFTRVPRPKIESEVSSSTPTPPQFLPTPFKDMIVENHDARVILNEEGDILLLWTFLDRSTLVITTNESTLREIISRRSTFIPNE